jgi:hypothetical protein
LASETWGRSLKKFEFRGLSSNADAIGQSSADSAKLADSGGILGLFLSKFLVNSEITKFVLGPLDTHNFRQLKLKTDSGATR